MPGARVGCDPADDPAPAAVAAEDPVEGATVGLGVENPPAEPPTEIPEAHQN
jgi:hypothetical protein